MEVLSQFFEKKDPTKVKTKGPKSNTKNGIVLLSRRPLRSSTAPRPFSSSSSIHSYVSNKGTSNGPIQKNGNNYSKSAPNHHPSKIKTSNNLPSKKKEDDNKIWFVVSRNRLPPILPKQEKPPAKPAYVAAHYNNNNNEIKIHGKLKRPIGAISINKRGQAQTSPKNEQGQIREDLSRSSSVTNLNSDHKSKGAFAKIKKSASKDRLDKLTEKKNEKKGISSNNNKVDSGDVDNSLDSLQEIELLQRQLMEMAKEKSELALELGERKGELHVLKNEITKLKMFQEQSTMRIEQLNDENTSLRNRLRDVAHSPLSDNEKQQLLLDTHRHSSAPASIATNISLLEDGTVGDITACPTPEWDKHSSSNVSEVSVACLQDKINQMQETHYSTNEELQATLQELTDLQRQLTELQQDNERLLDEKNLMFDSLCRQTERLNDARAEVESLKQLLYRDKDESGQFESIVDREQKLVDLLKGAQEERELLLVKQEQLNNELQDIRNINIEQIAEIEQLTERVRTLESTLDAKHAEHKQLDQELAIAKDQCSGRQIEINRLTDLLENARTKINELEQERALNDKSELDELLDNARKEKDALESEVANLKEQVARSRNETEKLREQISILQEECKVTRNNAKCTQSELEYKCEKLSAEKTNLTEQLQQIQEAANELQVQTQCQLEDKRQLSAVLSETQRNLSEAERKNSELDSEIEELKKLRKNDNEEWEKFQNDLLTSVRVANDFKSEAQQELQTMILENKAHRERVRQLEAQIAKLKGVTNDAEQEIAALPSPASHLVYLSDSKSDYAHDSDAHCNSKKHLDAFNEPNFEQSFEPQEGIKKSKFFSVIPLMSCKQETKQSSNRYIDSSRVINTVPNSDHFFLRRRKESKNFIKHQEKRFSNQEQKNLEMLNSLYSQIDPNIPKERLTVDEQYIVKLKDTFDDVGTKMKPIAKAPKETLFISKPLLTSVLNNPKLKEVTENANIIHIDNDAAAADLTNKPSTSLDDFHSNLEFQYYDQKNHKSTNKTLENNKVTYDTLNELYAKIDLNSPINQLTKEEQFVLKLKQSLDEMGRKNTLKKISQKRKKIKISEPLKTSVLSNRRLVSILDDPNIKSLSKSTGSLNDLQTTFKLLAYDDLSIEVQRPEIITRMCPKHGSLDNLTLGSGEIWNPYEIQCKEMGSLEWELNISKHAREVSSIKNKVQPNAIMSSFKGTSSAELTTFDGQMFDYNKTFSNGKKATSNLDFPLPIANNEHFNITPNSTIMWKEENNQKAVVLTNNSNSKSISESENFDAKDAIDTIDAINNSQTFILETSDLPVEQNITSDSQSNRNKVHLIHKIPMTNDNEYKRRNDCVRKKTEDGDVDVRSLNILTKELMSQNTNNEKLKIPPLSDVEFRRCFTSDWEWNTNYPNIENEKFTVTLKSIDNSDSVKQEFVSSAKLENAEIKCEPKVVKQLENKVFKKEVKIKLENVKVSSLPKISFVDNIFNDLQAPIKQNEKFGVLPLETSVSSNFDKLKFNIPFPLKFENQVPFEQIIQTDHRSPDANDTSTDNFEPKETNSTKLPITGNMKSIYEQEDLIKNELQQNNDASDDLFLYSDDARKTEQSQTDILETSMDVIKSKLEIEELALIKKITANPEFKRSNSELKDEDFEFIKDMQAKYASDAEPIYVNNVFLNEIKGDLHNETRKNYVHGKKPLPLPRTSNVTAKSVNDPHETNDDRYQNFDNSSQNTSKNIKIISNQTQEMKENDEKDQENYRFDLSSAKIFGNVNKYYANKQSNSNADGASEEETENVDERRSDNISDEVPLKNKIMYTNTFDITDMLTTPLLGEISNSETKTKDNQLEGPKVIAYQQQQIVSDILPLPNVNIQSKYDVLEHTCPDVCNSNNKFVSTLDEQLKISRQKNRAPKMSQRPSYNTIDRIITSQILNSTPKRYINASEEDRQLISPHFKGALLKTKETRSKISVGDSTRERENFKKTDTGIQINYDNSKNSSEESFLSKKTSTLKFVKASSSFAEMQKKFESIITANQFESETLKCVISSQNNPKN